MSSSSAKVSALSSLAILSDGVATAALNVSNGVFVLSKLRSCCAAAAGDELAVASASCVDASSTCLAPLSAVVYNCRASSAAAESLASCELLRSDDEGETLEVSMRFIDVLFADGKKSLALVILPMPLV